MAKGNVRPWVKYSGLGLIAIAIVGALWYLGNSGKVNGSTGSLFGGGSSGDCITIGTNTYAGFLPFMYLNGGLDPNEESIIYKEYGIKLKIVIQDDFQAGRAAFKNNDIDLIYCTADAFPVEMSEGSEMSDARFVNISNWSRGADAIVVSKNIRTVADLKGKIVACSEGTASHTLLLNTLETNGITWIDVNTKSSVLPDKVNLKIVASGLDAASIFKAGQCDAAVVFSPDDQDLISSIPGAHVLVSTKQASSIICDGLIAKDSWIKDNREDLKTLLKALLWANTKMNTDPKAVKEAARAFADSYGTDEDFAIEGSKNIYYVTLADEANFFGLESSYTGIKGDELYSKMARTYEALGLCKSPVSWRKASDPSIIEELYDNPTEVQGDQKAEKTKTFAAPTAAEEESQEVISTKKLTIEFPMGSNNLDGNAQSLIDREFVGIAKQFSGARIRIEGNCDNTGSQETNLVLSKKRAQSVADYLSKTYGFDKNRFIVIGNGSKKAIEAGSVGPDQNYRTTDFELVSE